MRDTIPVRWSPRGGAAHYTVTVEFEHLAGRVECAALKVDSDNAVRYPVTGTVLRQLRVEESVLKALAVLRNNAMADVISRDVPLLNAADLDPAAVEHIAKGRRAQADHAMIVLEATEVVGEGHGRRYGPDHLKRVAEVYVEAVERHERPTRAVAQAFALTASAAGNHVARARAAGLLAPTEPGRVPRIAAPKRGRKSR